MQLHELKPKTGSRRKKMRVGRGNGMRKGTYSGRGGKGQTARTGGVRRPGFEGGQTPLIRRMPKLGGFRNVNRVEHAVVNVGDFEKHFKEGDTVDRAALVEKGLVRSSKPIKVLGNGDLKMALTVKVEKISASAKEKIEAANGQILT